MNVSIKDVNERQMSHAHKMAAIYSMHVHPWVNYY
jgi:hypothetical protein